MVHRLNLAHLQILHVKTQHTITFGDKLMHQTRSILNNSISMSNKKNCRAIGLPKNFQINTLK